MRWRGNKLCAGDAAPQPGQYFMDSGLFNLLKVLAYLVVSTVGIVALAGWALNRFGPPKK
jgi:hypothetical protein